ncbi:hypothetical protein AB0B39_11705, partial [Micromonospora sp. NPDC049114]|uniref:hypothetical protein n=1 Tax=Micromonospora sp. NPDC049114 TaxID=3155498 RepID=UPI003402013A
MPTNNAVSRPTIAAERIERRTVGRRLAQRIAVSILNRDRPIGISPGTRPISVVTDGDLLPTNNAVSRPTIAAERIERRTVGRRLAQ